MEKSKFFPTTFAITNGPTSEGVFEFVLDPLHIHSREVVVNRVSIEKGMAHEIERCKENRFTYFNTVGGLLLNKQLSERNYLRPWSKFTEVFDVFYFLIALFCQVFEEVVESVFYVDWTELYEVGDHGEIVPFCVKDFVCSDGNIRRSVRYECDAGNDQLQECKYMRRVYESPLTDLGYVRLGYNSVGHFPRGSPKKYFKNHLYYDKEHEMQNYEDRCYKHLYEGHHKCMKKRYCSDFCKLGLEKTNYKRRDYYQVENEEMSCRDAKMNYDTLSEFFCERKRLDRMQKFESYNTMIPPPASRDCSNRRYVYVTELEKDLSSSRVCPSQLLDPCWVDYDEDALMGRVKHVGGNDVKGDGLENIVRRGTGYLYNLNKYVRCFSRDAQPDPSTLKVMLFQESRQYVGNFILTASIEVLRRVVNHLEDRLWTDGDEMLTKECVRPLYSPSCVHLLSLLNVLRRSSFHHKTLSDSELMTEQTGSMLGSVLKERSILLKDCYAVCRRMRSGKAKGVIDPTRVAHDTFTSNPNGVYDHREDINDLETKLLVYQVLIDVYKYVSIDVHHWIGRLCPTCHPIHLIKQELQTMIESVREAIPLGLDGLELSSYDPVNIEPIGKGSRVKFVERERASLDLIEEFRRHSEVGKLINDCDLVAKGYREYPKATKRLHRPSGVSNELNNYYILHMHDFCKTTDGGSLEMENVRKRLDQELLADDEKSILAQANEDSFFSPNVGYYPYKLSFWDDAECCKIASTFTSIRDDVRYQGCDRAGTYDRVNLFGASSVQRTSQRMERMNRYHPLPPGVVRRRIVRPVRRQLNFDGGDEQQEENVTWREQRDSIRIDFACALRDLKNDEHDDAVWLNVFGKYWVGLEDWCKSDVDQMHWLMMGANHMTVDTCGENMGSYVIGSQDIDDSQCSSVIHTTPRALRRELGMQLPIRSHCKVRRNLLKFRTRNELSASHAYDDPIMNDAYWKSSGYVDDGFASSGCFKVLLPNSKDCFFDECIVQHFYPFTFYPTMFIGTEPPFRDVYDFDNHHRTSYQQLQMDVSRELRTFAVGAPRFSSNGPLTNFDNGNFVVRDCRHVGLAPLFRYHYEMPTNPNAEWIDGNLVNRLLDVWRPDRKLDVFQDPNAFGYVASQLTHLPLTLGYEFGNVLSFDTNELRLQSVSEASCLRDIFEDITKPFNQRRNSVALQQREVIRDDSVYVVNRRSRTNAKCFTTTILVRCFPQLWPPMP